VATTRLEGLETLGAALGSAANVDRGQGALPFRDDVVEVIIVGLVVVVVNIKSMSGVPSARRA